ncbi:MAG: hypothetical protein C0603_00640 [Denitrovibrio sp.]|nr:MAG: hypothetical protein C0603_00640 [Denitrovibrio sp.]
MTHSTKITNENHEVIKIDFFSAGNEIKLYCKQTKSLIINTALIKQIISNDTKQYIKLDEIININIDKHNFTEVTIDNITTDEIKYLLISFNYLNVQKNLVINNPGNGTNTHHIVIHNSNIEKITTGFFDTHLSGLTISNSSVKSIRLVGINILNIDLRDLEVSENTFLAAITSKRIDIQDSFFDNKFTLTNTTTNDKLNIQNNYFKLPPKILLDKHEIYTSTIFTVREIKVSHELKYNKIEANKFHAIELSKQKEELDKEISTKWKDIKRNKQDSKELKPFLNILPDWLVFNFHQLTSNHSQNWVLPIYWIVMFAMFSSTFIFPFNTFLIPVFAITVLVYLFMKLQQFKEHQFYTYIFYLPPLLALTIIHLLINWFSLSEFFSYLEYSYKLTNTKLHGLHYVLNKGIVAYLTYQFILGVRKDTRR